MRHASLIAALWADSPGPGYYSGPLFAQQRLLTLLPGHCCQLMQPFSLLMHHITKLITMKNIIIVLLTLMLFISCDKNEDLVDITSQCKFYDDILNPCFYAIHNSDYDEIVFRNNEAYQEFQDSIRGTIAYMNCETAKLSSIDFKKYTLIGKKTSGGGCSVNYQRKIFDDKVNKIIKYKISAIYSGYCAMLISSWNWAFIPKLSDDYMVEFQITEQQESLKTKK